MISTAPERGTLLFKILSCNGLKTMFYASQFLSYRRGRWDGEAKNRTVVLSVASITSLASWFWVCIIVLHSCWQSLWKVISHCEKKWSDLSLGFPGSWESSVAHSFIAGSWELPNSGYASLCCTAVDSLCGKYLFIVQFGSLALSLGYPCTNLIWASWTYSVSLRR